MRTLVSTIAMLLLASSACLCAATSITYEQTQWTVSQMTDQNGVANGIFPYSYDTRERDYSLHLVGKVDLQNINSENLSSLSVELRPGLPEGYYFVSSDPNKEKIPYTVEVFIRSRLVDAWSDNDIAVTGATFGGSGPHGYDDILGSTSAGVKFVWMQDDATVSIPIPLENAAGKKYQNTHVDILVVFKQDVELSEDYSTTFYCTYTKNNSDIHTFPFTILGTGHQGGGEGGTTVETHTFNVAATSLAEQYELDNADVIGNYQTVANVSYSAKLTNPVNDPPTIDQALYEIVLSPTSDYTATGIFQFVNTKNPAVKIPYYVMMERTSNAPPIAMGDVAINEELYKKTSPDLSGDEIYSHAHGTNPRRYVVVPMVDKTNYSYEGAIKIMIPDDVLFGDSGVSFRQALSHNATQGYFSAGTFRSTIYVSLISQL